MRLRVEKKATCPKCKEAVFVIVSGPDAAPNIVRRAEIVALQAAVEKAAAHCTDNRWPLFDLESP